MTDMLPGEAYLNPFKLDEELREIVEPQLFFNNLAPNTDTTERAVIYDVLENTANKDLQDGVMTLPAPAGEEAALTKLKMRNITSLEGKIPKIGYEFDISRDVLSSSVRTISDLNVKMKKAGYGISYAVNKFTLQVLQAGAKELTYNPTTVWDSNTGDQNPIKDMIEAWYDFIDYGYPNRAYTTFLHFNNHKELAEFLIDMDIDFQFVGENIIEITGNPAMAGRQFYNVNDQYTEGKYLTMDLRPNVHPGFETYRYIDPKFGIEIPKADPNEATTYTGININVTTMDKNPFTTTVEMWLNYLPVVKIEDVIGEGDGI